MTPYEIRAALQERGATLTAVAQVIGVTVTTVSKVIDGKDKSRRVASVISNFLEIPLDTLWPGKYPARYARRTSAEGMASLSAALEKSQRAAA